jgi:hypothetical protein
VTPVPIGAPTAENGLMRLRGSAASRSDQADGGELEGWIADLAGGEPSVRRLRERLDAQREGTDHGCTACGCSDGAQRGRRTA